MGKFAKDEFTPKNPQKYVGKYPIIYRSSWEWSMMRTFDDHPDVVQWSSETVSIPYRNPLTGKWSMYIPDFMVLYADRDGNQHCEMIEVKPLKEVPGFDGKVNQRTKLVQAINQAKWSAAMAFCKKRGIHFRVATEDQIFKYKRK